MQRLLCKVRLPISLFNIWYILLVHTKCLWQAAIVSAFYVIWYVRNKARFEDFLCLLIELYSYLEGDLGS